MENGGVQKVATPMKLDTNMQGSFIIQWEEQKNRIRQKLAKTISIDQQELMIVQHETPTGLTSLDKFQQTFQLNKSNRPRLVENDTKDLEDIKYLLAIS